MILAETALSFIGLGLRPPPSPWDSRCRIRLHRRTSKREARETGIDMLARIEIEGLQVYFPTMKAGVFGDKDVNVKAVNDVSFAIPEGETVGLVAESGSGKTTIGRAMLRAIDATDGWMIFRSGAGETDLRALRGNKVRRVRKYMQLIFQDPYSSLILPAAAAQGYEPDCVVCSDDVPMARPTPMMM